MGVVDPFIAGGIHLLVGASLEGARDANVDARDAVDADDLSRDVVVVVARRAWWTRDATRDVVVSKISSPRRRRRARVGVRVGRGRTRVDGDERVHARCDRDVRTGGGRRGRECV